jgi:PAS domain-containing protein
MMPQSSSTARSAASDAAAPAQDRYRAVFEAVDAGCCILEPIFEGDRAVDYRFLEVNSRFESQTGLANPSGRTASELVPDIEPFWCETYGRVATTGEAARFESGVKPLGRWFDVHAFRIGEPGTRQVAVLFTDITERRNSEDRARESGERLTQALAAGNGIGTWSWDVVADRVTADERFSRLYGVRPELGLLGAPIEAFLAGIHPDDLPATRESILEAMRTGTDFAAEYRLIRPDGAIRWVAAQGRCKLGAQGEPVRFPGVSFDITARKQADLRQRALLELSDAIRDLSDPGDIAYAASAILGRALQVGRVGYGVIDKVMETIAIERDWNAPGVTTLAGTLRFREFGSYIEDLKAGRAVVIANVDLDPRTRDTGEALKAISAASFVNMPLVEQDDFVALIYANDGAPRAWSDDDLLLIREVAERVRTATERLKAEGAKRESEEQFSRLCAGRTQSDLGGAAGRVFLLVQPAGLYVRGIGPRRDRWA